ncbi:PREDICTED: FAS-associated death domain protein [Nanorana parkeri]|uniref:FAS-associated death domain protein n=1 Tax=Nanorana parkeri TaxID=125878 RepID=UPI000854CA64|nr:PREDICTED: FAS-associated death domain protein [Nanorana parkeri]
MDNFNILLLRISGKLSETDLSNMKFLCQDKIPRKKMETIMIPTDLFTKLMELTELSKDNLDFLIQLLQHAHRHDLAEEVKGFQMPLSREEVSVDEESDEDQLGQAFDIICENVGKDWKMLIRTLGITDSTIEQVAYANPYNMKEQIRQCLREWKKKKRENANVSVLIKALENCRMKLVADKLSDKLNLSHGES